mgnify:CR=1 FL=1
MMDRSQKIIGQKIIEFSFFEHQISQLVFEDKSQLTIYYPLNFEGKVDYQQIAGSKLLDIAEDEDGITLVLSSGRISLDKVEDYGPEFMQLKLSGSEKIIIWN